MLNARIQTKCCDELDARPSARSPVAVCQAGDGGDEGEAARRRARCSARRRRRASSGGPRRTADRDAARRSAAAPRSGRKVAQLRTLPSFEDEHRLAPCALRDEEVEEDDGERAAERAVEVGLDRGRSGRGGARGRRPRSRSRPRSRRRRRGTCRSRRRAGRRTRPTAPTKFTSAVDDAAVEPAANVRASATEGLTTTRVVQLVHVVLVVDDRPGALEARLEPRRDLAPRRPCRARARRASPTVAARTPIAWNTYSQTCATSRERRPCATSAGSSQCSRSGRRVGPGRGDAEEQREERAHRERALEDERDGPGRLVRRAAVVAACAVRRRGRVRRGRVRARARVRRAACAAARGHRVRDAPCDGRVRVDAEGVRRAVVGVDRVRCAEACAATAECGSTLCSSCVPLAAAVLAGEGHVVRAVHVEARCRSPR